MPVGGGGAWPGFETTRRAKLAARTARGRAAAQRHTQRPGPSSQGYRTFRVAVWPCLMSGVACCPDRFLAAAWHALVGLAAVCAGGRRPVAWLVAPTDLRPPRGLPARSPSAPRALLGASSRSPARPRRPHGGLQSGGACRLCVDRLCRRPPAPRPGPPTLIGPRRPSIGRCSLSVRCRPGPAIAHQYRGLVLPPPINFACNSPTTLSNPEFTTLELQRFQTWLKIRPIELHATFA